MDPVQLYWITDKLAELAGREISCPEFERIAGREKNKKWKSSFRVVENGIDGTCVETWLKVIALSYRTFQASLFVIEACR